MRHTTTTTARGATPPQDTAWAASARFTTLLFLGPLSGALLFGAGCAMPLDDEGVHETEGSSAALEPNTALPEFPAVDRSDSVQAIDAAGRFTRPFLPSHRTTADGRVALPVIDGRWLYLNAPERLTGPFASGAPGLGILADHGGRPGAKQINLRELVGRPTDTGSVGHRAICDATPQFPELSGHAPNPTSCGTPSEPADCYRFTIVTAWNEPLPGRLSTQLWARTMRLRVLNPKTASARIDASSIAWEGPPRPGMTFETPGYNGNSSPFLEPTFTSDGRLLVFRQGELRTMTWRNENVPAGEPGHEVTDNYDIVYAVAPSDAAPCDISAFTEILPITHAPYDPDMVGRYGFAQYPFRDPQGTVIPDGVDLPATYPWIDRAGDNLMFETVSAHLHYVDNGQVRTRYPTRCGDGSQDCNLNPSAAQVQNNGELEHLGNKRGVGIAGSWTRGRMVVFDGAVNNTDFAIPAEPEKHRQVRLYAPGTGPAGDESGWVPAGVGHDTRMPASVRDQGADGNANVIDSMENLFNHHEAFRPRSPRDVVWWITSGHSTAEVALDDFIDAKAFIVSDMVPSLSYVEGRHAMDQHSGFNGRSHWGTGFGAEVRMQNAATTTSFAVPAYGRVEGGARSEPIAMGGVEGRGLFLDGDDSLAYSVPETLPTSVENGNWIASLFVDPRHGDDGQARRLLTFPDGTRVAMVGRSALRIDKGDVTMTLALPGGPAPRAHFRHFAFRATRGGARVDVFMDGMRFHRWSAEGGERLFRMSAGEVVVGARGGDGVRGEGVRGWVDDLRVFAHAGSDEYVCNLGRGTLLALDGSTGPLRQLANRYPAATHQAIEDHLRFLGSPAAGPFVCHHDYDAEHGVDASRPPAGTARVGGTLHMPQPLVFDQPRPNARNNFFCRTCHVDGNAPGLDLAALEGRWWRMQYDTRRQPMQGPRAVYGHVPANYFGPGRPAVAIDATSSGVLADEFVY